MFGPKNLSDALARIPRAAHQTHAQASKNDGHDEALDDAPRAPRSHRRRCLDHPRCADLRHSTTPPPVVAAFTQHLAAERGLAARSIDGYQRDLVAVARFLHPRGVELDGATGDDFSAYLRELSRAGRSSATVCRRLVAIRGFLNFRFLLGGLSAARQIAAALARLEWPKREDRLPLVLTRAEVARLLECRGRRSWLFPRDLAILELLYASGIRAGELCALRLADVGASSTLRVTGKGARERVVLYGRAAAQAIAWYLQVCRPSIDRGISDRLFLSHHGRALQRRRLYTIVYRYAVAAGLPRIGPHALRHCFASHLLGGGADLRVIQELLGHASINSTQRYTRVDYQRLKEIHRRFHPRP